jgi:hypothetical protein
MYYKDQKIPELYYMSHRNDTDTNFIDYEKMILDKTLSPNLFKNNNLSLFIETLQKPISMLFDNVNIIKNFKNYMVDKYYYMHKS